MIVFLTMLLFCVSAFPVQDQLQKYFSFSLSGGNIGEKFNLAGDVFWVQEFKNGLFAQGSGFVLGKEYGASLGFGLSGQNLGVYLFGDSLYHQSLFFQIRPTVRLTFPWLSLTASYALPVGKSTTKIGDEQVSAAKYWSGELNILPVDWARIYAEAMSVENSYTRYRVGAEVRVLKWLSLSADWNKSNSNLYSKWSGYEDWRVVLNFSLNGKQSNSKLNQKIQMQPQYPILVARSDEPKPPKPDPCEPQIGEVVMINVVIDYYRIQVDSPEREDVAKIIGSFTDYSTKSMTKVENDHFQYTCTLKANSNPKTYPYYVAVYDAKRQVGGTTLVVSAKIIVNGVELITEKWMSDGPYKIFWLDKCTVITK